MTTMIDRFLQVHVVATEADQKRRVYKIAISRSHAVTDRQTSGWLTPYRASWNLVME